MERGRAISPKANDSFRRDVVGSVVVSRQSQNRLMTIKIESPSMHHSAMLEAPMKKSAITHAAAKTAMGTANTVRISDEEIGFSFNSIQKLTESSPQKEHQSQ